MHRSPDRNRRFVGGVLSIVLVLSLPTVGTSCGAVKKNTDKTVRLPVGSSVFHVEIADTEPLRVQGLMGRKELGEDRGMLFVFPDSQRRSFWMKDTYLPLSIAYINRHGEILEMYDMEPLSTEPVPSRYPVKYALEVGQGTFQRLNVNIGDKVDLRALPSWVDGR